MDTLFNALKTARRQKIEARAVELIDEEMALRELRKAKTRTQVKVAKKLGITRRGVLRLEKRIDLMLSSLRKAVEARGGKLNVVVEFPNRKPVVLVRFAGDEPAAVATKRRRGRG